MSAIALGMIIFAYLCGSISSAILVCKLAGLPDPRISGSGNPGATNVLRIGGKASAAAVLIFDVAKGMVPVWIAWMLVRGAVEAIAYADREVSLAEARAAAEEEVARVDRVSALSELVKRFWAMPS